MRQWGVVAVATLALWTSPLPQSVAAQASGFEILGPNFVAIQTRDVDAASGWYQTIFGLAEVNRIEAEELRYTIVVLSGENLSVELIQHRGVEPPPVRHLGLFKVGFYVGDIDAAHHWLRERGVDADANVFFDEALQAHSFVFRDLEGNRLQLFQRCSVPC